MHPARLVGINHVALEVGSIEEALAFYGRFFDIRLRGVAPGMAFIDMGDQFLALSEDREQGPTTAATSGSSSTTRTRSAPPSRTPASTSSRAAGCTSATRGATASRSSTTATSSSPRRRRCSTAWASSLEKRPGALAELREKGLL